MYSTVHFFRQRKYVLVLWQKQWIGLIKIIFIVIVNLLQNYNIKINTSQSNLYKSLYSQTQARSQKSAIGREACFGSMGAKPSALKTFVFFWQK